MMASLADLLGEEEEDQLVLVDLLDREIGSMGKLQCHREGLLHRAFSLFLYRVRERDGQPTIQVLMQRRARGKYHSGGLLTNSVCSHPRVGEELRDAVARRVGEELGVPANVAGSLEYEEAGSFVYRCAYPRGVTEFEYDHVFVAPFDGRVEPDPREASRVAWVNSDEVLDDLARHPQRYTAWFLTAAPMAVGWLEEHLLRS